MRRLISSSKIRQDGVSTPAGCYVARWPQRSHEPCRIEPKKLTWCVCACVGFHVMEDRKGVWVSGRREVVGSARTDWAAVYSLMAFHCPFHAGLGARVVRGFRIWKEEKQPAHPSKANIQNGKNNSPRHLRAYESNRSKRPLSSHPSQYPTVRVVPYTRGGGFTSPFIKKPHKHRY